MNQSGSSVISKRLLRSGPIYDLWEETSNDLPPEQITMTVARTKQGDYIGTKKWAEHLCDIKGIHPEVVGDGRTCSIGFCPRENRWYGWSHRAIHGFGLGDEVKEGDCTASSGSTDEWLAEHPEADVSLPVGFKAKTLEDAKLMAIAFADSVG